MIGVLDLQGDVVEHLDHLDRLSIRNIRVKKPADFEGLKGLIIPGGESTCIGRLLKTFGLDEVIKKAFNKGMKVWGTCAGAIIIATSIIGEKPYLGLMDIVVERNSFGSQLDSFFTYASIPAVSDEPIPLTFIRAPKIKAVGPGVRVLLQLEDYIAAAESEGALATVFHPEMTESLAFHRYFALKCGITVPDLPYYKDDSWTLTSWTKYCRVC
ncbi:MAG: pyridoxal 5'-phosphate synthase glutaminase subunit PdxT [Syntrophales bacterium]|nr:pyridoxal 5'-phosphate synthase glutaminase subunit PdxT [Syntrophales bacterium]